MSTTAYPEDTPAPTRKLERSAGVQRLLAQFRPRLRDPIPRNELRAEGVLALAFLLTAAPLAALAPRQGSHSLWLIVLFIVIYAITSRVEFDLGAGYCVPSQIVLVPMLFALPAAWVPLLVAGALFGGRLMSFLKGERHPV
ncbi:MAG: hypothetical protein JO244_13420, partial [Solirubrobacterales bacterium]|nr:hypothetical protein [Solirubrobacterales bacterium]